MGLIDFTPLLHTPTSKVERALWVLVWALFFQSFNSFDPAGCFHSWLLGQGKMVTCLGPGFSLSYVLRGHYGS